MSKIKFWKLEFYHLNSLPENEMKLMEEKVSKSEGAKKEIQNIRKKNEEFFSKYPYEKILEKLERETSENRHLRSNRKSLMTWIPALSMALLFTVIGSFLWLPNRQIKSFTEWNERIILKGSEIQFRIFQNIQNHKLYSKNGSIVSENDRLYIEYGFSEDYYVVIFSIDGNGNITFHLPNESHEKPVVLKGRGILDYTYVLDNAPEFEKFYLIYSKDVFNIGEIEGLVRKAIIEKYPSSIAREEIHFPDTFGQRSITLFKKNH